MAATIPAPDGAVGYHTSLLTAQDCRNHIHLILGSNPLAASRATQSLAAGAKPIIISPPSTSPSSEKDQEKTIHYTLSAQIDAGLVTHLSRPFQEDDLFTLGRDEVSHVVDAVFVTSSPRDSPLAKTVSDLCKRNRIPVNVVDAPGLCSFSLLSAHVDGPLQIGVTTNGQGCKLASRIRREVAASLPKGLGEACARLGSVRRRIVDEDVKLRARAAVNGDGEENEGVDDSIDQTASFNKLITDDDADAAKTRRMRWLSQVCEYWPLKRLSSITDADVGAILESYRSNTDNNDAALPADTPLTNGTAPPPGRIILAGSGPGHPDLLTRATHKAIQSADLILADKLVPAGVLELIPRRTPVSIARKFPGNADRAQEELLEQALAGVRAGKTVLRLKQGDPFIYGRGGEEVDFFRAHGLGDRVLVLPGITSSLSAPLFAGIPATQRDVADQVLICTGTGKKGKPPVPPEYVASRTVVFLMALHRIRGLVGELTRYDWEELGTIAGEGDDQKPSLPPRRELWPIDTPCAVIERASCPDQRVIRTTLEWVAEAVELEGSRPPGLLVVGRACEALYKPKSGVSWTVEDEGFEGLDLDGLLPGGVMGVVGLS